jgi:hypothetical protein
MHEQLHWGFQHGRGSVLFMQDNVTHKEGCMGCWALVISQWSLVSGSSE